MKADRVKVLNTRLWTAYERGMDVGSTTPLAFVIRAHSETDARSLASKLGGDLIWLKQKWWPLGRRWELAVKGRPVRLTLEAIDRWSDEIASAIEPLDARLTHWVPAPAASVPHV